MSLPTRDTILGMSFSSDGTPYVHAASKSGQIANGMEWSKDGTPIFFAPIPSIPSGDTNFQVNIGGTWKTVSSIQIQVGGVWKNVTNASVNIGGVWKSIY